MLKPRSLARATLVLGAGLSALALAACGDDNNDKSSSDSSQPKALNVSIDASGKPTAPASTDGGLTKLTVTNNSKNPDGIQLVRIEGDHTDAEVLKILGSESAPIPEWLTDGAGVGTVKPGGTGTSTQSLPAGNWVVATQPDGDNAKPQLSKLEIKGGSADDPLPAATAKISAFEYGFKASGLKAGQNDVEFDNTGAQLHHVQAFPLAQGKTIADVKKFLASNNQQGQPPLEFQKGTGTTVLDGGQKQVTTLNLQKGKNVLICFISDRTGGPPHFTKGMITEVDVS
jgi:hypothetical protein